MRGRVRRNVSPFNRKAFALNRRQTPERRSCLSHHPAAQIDAVNYIAAPRKLDRMASGSAAKLEQPAGARRMALQRPIDESRLTGIVFVAVKKVVVIRIAREDTHARIA